MRSFQCPVCGKAKIRYSQLIRGLVPFMPRSRCDNCGSRVVLARSVRDNALGAAVLGLMILAGVSARTGHRWFYFIYPFVLVNILAWLRHRARFIAAPRPDRVEIFFVALISVLFILAVTAFLWV